MYIIPLEKSPIKCSRGYYMIASKPRILRMKSTPQRCSGVPGAFRTPNQNPLYSKPYLEVHGYFISGVISPLTCIVTLLITPFITTHEPPSKASRPEMPGRDPEEALYYSLLCYYCTTTTALLWYCYCTDVLSITVPATKKNADPDPPKQLSRSEKKRPRPLFRRGEGSLLIRSPKP